jgi:hypothetical protein
MMLSDLNHQHMTHGVIRCATTSNFFKIYYRRKYLYMHYAHNYEHIYTCYLYEHI